MRVNGAFSKITSGVKYKDGFGTLWQNGGLRFEASRSWTGETSAVGENQPHNNLQPYIVTYMWKRIS